MSKNTIKQLATLVGTSVDHFINQLKLAGVEISSEDQTLSNQETEQLRAYLLKQKKAGKPLLSGQPIATKRTSTEALKFKGRTTAQTTVNITLKKRKADYIQHSVSAQTATETVIKSEEIPQEPPVQASESVSEQEMLASVSPIQSTDTSSEKENKQSPEDLSRPHKREKDKEKKLKHHSRNELKQKRYEKSDFYRLETQTDEFSRTFRSKVSKRKKEGLKHEFEKPTAPIIREVTLPESITVTDLAQKMSIKVGEVIKKLMKLGVLATATQTLEQETASILVEEMGHIPKLITHDTVEADLQASTLHHQTRGAPVTRPPVITIMGHVDHGKTSLLDYIRRTKVASGEAGGITQHIGAYHVELPKGMITFLDTPGHAAFTAMRARGARLTDIVALIVAADDGVMPQTIEAIQHAQAANVPIVVAVNKMDKPGADLNRIQQELANYNLIPESWGGETLFVPVSAKTGAGIDELLEALLVQAEVLELKAPATGPARGLIIESRLDKGRGPVATLLVQEGQLHKGDVMLAGPTYGRIRALYDENGNTVLSAGPSIPVEILGLSSVATSGDEAIVVPTERKAREAALFRSAVARESKIKRLSRNKEEGLISQLDAHAKKSLNIVLKADVQGSAEVLRDSLNKLSNEEIQVKLLTTGIGAITESDVNLALASKALLLGFNVRADNTAKQISNRENIEIHYHSVIYELLDQIKHIMGGLLTPIVKEHILGLAEVREVFRSAKLGTIAGCQVVEGLIKRSYPIRVLRDNIIIHQGELTSLKRFKDDVNEVRAGTECGVSIKNYTDVKVGDMIEVYERITVNRTE